MLDCPALNLAIVADEPVAAAPVLDRAGLDRRALNRKACRHFSLLYNTITDRYGRSLIRDIGPGFNFSDASVFDHQIAIGDGRRAGAVNDTHVCQHDGRGLHPHEAQHVG